MKILIYLTILVLLSGCSKDMSDDRSISEFVRYFKDDRTGTCFATTVKDLQTYSATLATVECTEKVEALLENRFIPKTR